MSLQFTSGHNKNIIERKNIHLLFKNLFSTEKYVYTHNQLTGQLSKDGDALLGAIIGAY